MEIGSIAATTAASRSESQLAANVDTFLLLLTAQLRNQDPLEPMDTNEFTQQLVQFSQVEQQINSNKNLESLIALTKAGSAADAVSYLGKTLTLTDGMAALINGEARWIYALDNDAATATLTILDARGQVVHTTQAELDAGVHSFDWNGLGNGGVPLPPGPYKLMVIAKTSDGVSIGTRVASQGVISEVDLTGNEPILMIGPLGVPMSKATLLSQTP
ncbi:MAG TPA: flagellar hook assembly protein FlgD [Aestuariivirgaceae bacterium]